MLPRMGMEDIWTRLSVRTRDWLVANNGDQIPDDIAEEIDDAVEAADVDDVWAVEGDLVSARGLTPDDEDEDDEVDDEEFGPRFLSDDAVDWIEEFADEE